MTSSEQKVAKKAKAHIVYKLKDGTRVPGTTTITGVMDKPALVYWANNIGLQGIDVRKYVDELSITGTLAHYMVECHLTGKTADMADYTPNQIDLAENAVLKYFEWEKGKTIEPIGNEMALVSQKHRFGGMCDFYCNLNGVPTLIDFKTCKALYNEHFTQVVAYANLLTQNGYQVGDVRILRIGREESEGFEDRKVSNIDLHWKRFLVCRELYELNKKIGR